MKSNNFYFIPHSEIINHSHAVFDLLTNCQGCEWTIDREGLTIKEGSHAHIKAHLYQIPLLKGRWQDPETV